MTELHPLGNTLLRSPEMFEKYHDNPKRSAETCFICFGDSLLMENMLYWKIIPNDFPYDAVAEKHIMLAPSRHVADEQGLHEHEIAELIRIKARLNFQKEYDCIIENLTRGRTILSHYHLHLIQWKRA